MVDKVIDPYQWYRIVDVRPTDEVLGKRKAAIDETIADLLVEDADLDGLLDLVDLVIDGGRQQFADKTRVARSLVSAIKKYQLSFPPDFTDNGLEVRVCAAICVAELLLRGDKHPLESSLLASAIISGLALRSPAKEANIQRMLEGAWNLAFDVLEKSAAKRRKRSKLDFTDLDDVDAIQDLWPALSPIISTLSEQASADREEIDILWWFNSRYCQSLRSSVTKLSIGDASVGCGVELAQRVLIPPSESCRQILRRLLREEKSSAQMRVTDVAKDFSSEAIGLLLGDGQAQLIVVYPSMFPISWLAKRISESGASSGWEREFKAKTGWASSKELTPEEWAAQVFNECVTRRMYASSLGK